MILMVWPQWLGAPGCCIALKSSGLGGGAFCAEAADDKPLQKDLARVAALPRWSAHGRPARVAAPPA